MLRLTSILASEVVIGDVADKFELPCQRVHTVTVPVGHRPDSNRRWLTPALKSTVLIHSTTTVRQLYMLLKRVHSLLITKAYNFISLAN